MEVTMLKIIAAGVAAVFVAMSAPAFAQAQSERAGAMDWNALTNMRINVIKAALQLTPDQDKYWPAIEKAIRAADLGLNPSNDGKVVRIPLPALTEERRKELSRHVHKLSEEGRNQVRQVRRDANDRLKKLLKDHAISEDDEKKGLDEVQKLTDAHIRAIEDLQKKKDSELLGK